MGTSVYIFGAVVAIVAGTVQACTGFGMALVAAPCLLLVLEPTLVTPTLVTLSTLNTLLVAWHGRRHVQAALVLMLAAGGITGFPLGIWVLKTVDANVLKVCVGAFVILFSSALLAGWRRPLKREGLARFPVGLAGGFMGGATSMGGPPVILFLANQDMPKDIFRGNIASYFFVVNCFGLAMFGLSGLWTAEVTRLAGVLIPPLLIGTYCGVRVAKALPEEQFRKVAMIAVAVMGVILVASSLYAILAG